MPPTNTYSLHQSIADIAQAYGRYLGEREIRYINQWLQNLEPLLLRLLHGEISAHYVADKLREVFSPATLKNIRNDQVLDRSYINSILASIKAEKVTQVQAFRKDVLKRKLVPPDQIGRWVSKTSKKDGKPTLWVNGIRLSGGETFRTLIKESENIDIEQKLYDTGYLRGQELTYLIGNFYGKDPIRKSVYVTEGGTLDRLRLISNDLRLAMGWKEWEASTFIMTGIYPIYRAIETDIQISSHNRYDNKIVLKIDPTSTAKEVIEHFEWCKENYFENPKARQPNPKTERLALFHVQSIIKKISTHAALEAWNNRCKNSKGWRESWIYDRKDVSNFKRDLRTAYEKYDMNREIEKENIQAKIYPPLQQGGIVR